MKICKKCQTKFSTWITVKGKKRNCQRRKYCFDCSPFGSGNTRNLTKPELTAKEKKAKKLRSVRKCQTKMRKERKQKLVDLLGGKCKYCGYDKYIGSLQFHHLRDKDFSISYWLLGKWERVLKEIKKCELVCANCHGEIHHS